MDLLMLNLDNGETIALGSADNSPGNKSFDMSYQSRASGPGEWTIKKGDFHAANHGGQRRAAGLDHVLARAYQGNASWKVSQDWMPGSMQGYL